MCHFNDTYRRLVMSHFIFSLRNKLLWDFNCGNCLKYSTLPFLNFGNFSLRILIRYLILTLTPPLRKKLRMSAESSLTRQKIGIKSHVNKHLFNLIRSNKLLNHLFQNVDIKPTEKWNLEGLKSVFSKRCASKIWGGSVRSDLKKLDSFTLETSKNHLIRNFSRKGRLRVNYKLRFTRKSIIV